MEWLILLPAFVTGCQNDGFSGGLGAAQRPSPPAPCALAPGSYDYEIWLMGVGFGGEYDSTTPQQILRAKIVVE